jgi:methionyl-tRNA formyltransferase
MRVGILSHSFTSALRVYNEVCSLTECDCYIVISPSPHRSSAVSMAANIARITKAGGQSLKLFRSGRVVLLNARLDAHASVERLEELQLDVGLHQTGIIYRSETIKAFRLGILNAHIGKLPEYRGRSVMEWSLLQGDATGVTVFFIDEGIDTGERIVVSAEVDVSHCESVVVAKQYLFDLAGSFYRKALVKLMSEEALQTNDCSGRRYYVMSKLFSGVVESLLTTKN